MPHGDVREVHLGISPGVIGDTCFRSAPSAINLI